MATNLTELASTRFSLTSAEEHFLGNVASGQMTDFQGSAALAVSTGSSWGRERSIKSDLLRWICMDPAARPFVDARGPIVQGAKFLGHLDLRNGDIAFPITLVHCYFDGNVDLLDARLRTLILSGCDLASLNADRLVLHGSLFMDKGFRARRIVRLPVARIQGTLECSSGSFSDPGGLALLCSGARISGDAFLNGVKVFGRTDFRDARVEGKLDLRGASLNAPLGTAICADFLEAQSIRMDDAFSAEGEVSLNGANLRHHIVCSGTFSNRNGLAISAHGVKAGGGIFLEPEFVAEGAAEFSRASIGEDFVAHGRFQHSGEPLVLENARIGGNAFLRKGFQTDGIVNLNNSAIAGSLTCQDMLFNGEHETGLSAERATVGGQFRWERITLARNTVLSLSYSSIGPIADDEGSWPTDGHLHLDGLKYSGVASGPTGAHRIRWLRRQPSEPYRPQPYEYLATYLLQEGREADAKKVQIQKNRMRLAYGNLNFFQRAWNHLLHLTIGFGYESWRALIWGVLVVAVGAGAFEWGYQSHVMAPAKSVLDDDRVYPPFSAVIYSMDTFLPIVSLGQKEYWRPDEAGVTTVCGWRVPGSWLRDYLVVHILSGWALTTLAIAGFTGLVRK